MIDSILLYAGGGMVLIGTAALLPRRTRRRGALLMAGGCAVAAAALAMPVTEKQVTRPAMLLDQDMPRWQFDERHSVVVDAPPERVYAAIHAVTANEIRFFRTLTNIRRGFRAAPAGILNAPEDEPLLHLATRTSFVYLHDVAPREIVVGTVIRPGLTTATMNFLITPIGANRCSVSTETRVFARTAAAGRHFAVYWRVIHPGSDIIRRSWLQAIKRRAEGGS